MSFHRLAAAAVAVLLLMLTPSSLLAQTESGPSAPTWQIQLRPMLGELQGSVPGWEDGGAARIAVGRTVWENGPRIRVSAGPTVLFQRLDFSSGQPGFEPLKREVRTWFIGAFLRSEADLLATRSASLAANLGVAAGRLVSCSSRMDEFHANLSRLPAEADCTDSVVNDTETAGHPRVSAWSADLSGALSLRLGSDGRYAVGLVSEYGLTDFFRRHEGPDEPLIRYGVLATMGF